MAGLHQSAAGRLSELIPSRDYSKLNEQDSQLRVWLPDPAKQALVELCELNQMSMTAYLTEFFVSYLYGLHELMRMRANNYGLYEPKEERRYSAMSPGSPPPEPDLGKNIFALKIWVPEQIKSGIEGLGKRVGLTLGEFSRAMICSHLFGSEYAADILASIVAADEYKARIWELSRS
jgi:hypothetical protein